MKIFVLTVAFMTVMTLTNFGQSIKKCDGTVLTTISGKIGELTQAEIRDFLLTFGEECQNNVEFREWSNELLFSVLDKQTTLMLQTIEREEKQIAFDQILEELSSPIHDGFDIKKIISKVEQVKTDDRLKKEYSTTFVRQRQTSIKRESALLQLLPSVGVMHSGQMTKEELFKDIQEIKSDKLFITDSVENVNEETKNNCWSISMTKEIASNCKVEELMQFLQDVKADRKEQIKKSKYKIGLIYYLWVDEQAGHLKFNFINSNHESLPFSVRVIFTDTEDEIISDFLTGNIAARDGLKIYKELL